MFWKEEKKYKRSVLRMVDPNRGMSLKVNEGGFSNFQVFKKLKNKKKVSLISVGIKWP